MWSSNLAVSHTRITIVVNVCTRGTSFFHVSFFCTVVRFACVWLSEGKPSPFSDNRYRYVEKPPGSNYAKYNWFFLYPV